jgi:GTP-binding protein EngB required for normal cell division
MTNVNHGTDNTDANTPANAADLPDIVGSKVRTVQVLYLSGAAATGKTSVINSLTSQESVRVLAKPSTTRSSYAKLGIKNVAECDGLGLERQLELQAQIFTDYAESVYASKEQAVREGYDVVAIDRSPLDHSSFLFQLVPELDLEFINKRMKDIDEVLTRVSDPLTTNGVTCNFVQTIWFFPFPMPWADHKSREDGFRNAPASRNYIWSNALQNMINTLSPNYQVRSNEFSISDTSSPEERARRILAVIMSDA